MPQKKNNSNNSEMPTNAYFLSLELENIRCFGEKQKINFSDRKGNPKHWTIILGDNGTGKTAILQSVLYSYLIARYKRVSGTKLDLRDFASIEKRKQMSSKISSKYSLRFKYTLSQNFLLPKEVKASSVLIKGGLMKGFVPSEYLNFKGYRIYSMIFAYGALRKVGETSISEQSEESPYVTLFNENASLINPEEWLLQADYASKRTSSFQEKRKNRLEKIKEILVKVLPDIDDIRFSEKDLLPSVIPQPIVEFHTHYGWVEAKDLSLGYRTSMSWMVDFASRMFDIYPESENPLAEPAVVLIDEIDLHLHPKWQRELLDYLSNLFPNTQFIVTTHSPLIVQSAVARDANIVVCRREDDHVVIDQSVEAVRNWRADQILTSDLFGLETARPKEIESFLEQRQEILSKAKLTKKDEERLAELEDKIGFMPVSEDNPEDDKAMDIIRRAAERLQSQAE
ncbi:MAG: AAA family ATPase [Pyrinomonadaceae bacterium]